MLVVSRRQGQRVRVRVPLPGGGHTDVWIVVTHVDRGKIRLGIACPRDCLISREELVPASERGQAHRVIPCPDCLGREAHCPTCAGKGVIAVVPDR